jgi:hypothetical protein
MVVDGGNLFSRLKLVQPNLHSSFSELEHND